MYDESADSGWLTPTLLNGWTEVANYPVRYRADSMGFVHFKGRVVNAATQNSGYILSLPDAYKPQETTSFATLKGSSFMKLTVSSWDTGVGLDGINVEANIQVFLDQICYRKKV